MTDSAPSPLPQGEERGEDHVDTGSAAGVGGVAGAAVGSLAGPMGAAIGAVGGMLAGAAAERVMHANDDPQPTDAIEEDDAAPAEEQ